MVEFEEEQAEIMMQEKASASAEEFQWTLEKVVGVIGLSAVAFLTFWPVIIAFDLTVIGLITATVGA